MTKTQHEQLTRDLLELKLQHVADNYQKVLDEAARQNTPMLNTQMQLISGQLAARRNQATIRRVRAARIPPIKTLSEYVLLHHHLSADRKDQWFRQDSVYSNRFFISSTSDFKVGSVGRSSGQ